MVVAIIILSFVTLISLFLFIAVLVSESNSQKVTLKDLYDVCTYNKLTLQYLEKFLEKNLENKKKES